MKDIPESCSRIQISIKSLVRAFNCPQSSVKLALGQWLDDPGHRGKHHAIDHDRERQVLDWIEQKIEKIHQSQKNRLQTIA
jgi:hypothetical protein